MKKTISGLLCIWILILLSPNAMVGCGAGTVLYFRIKGETYLLVADHNWRRQRDRGWSGFGGLCDSEPVDVRLHGKPKRRPRAFTAGGRFTLDWVVQRFVSVILPHFFWTRLSDERGWKTLFNSFFPKHPIFFRPLKIFFSGPFFCFRKIRSSTPRYEKKLNAPKTPPLTPPL